MRTFTTPHDDHHLRDRLLEMSPVFAVLAVVPTLIALGYGFLWLLNHVGR